MEPFRLRREEAAVLVVDIQDRLCKAMPEVRLARLQNRTCALLAGARTLGLPIFYTEQYPKGLGSTLEPVRACLEGRRGSRSSRSPRRCPSSSKRWGTDAR